MNGNARNITTIWSCQLVWHFPQQKENNTTILLKAYVVSYHNQLLKLRKSNFKIKFFQNDCELFKNLELRPNSYQTSLSIPGVVEVQQPSL